MRRSGRLAALRRVAALTALLAIAVAAPAVSQHAAGGHGAAGGGAQREVQISYDAMLPGRLDIVTGETVRWTNDSARVHTVTADDDSFDSGRLAVGRTFTHRFDAPGEAPYYCALHPLITGVVAAHDLLLDPPGQAAAPGKAFPIAGRSALAAGTSVAIEADSGTGFAPVATATVGDDGGFAARVVPTATATYRAVAGSVASDPVELLVLDRRIGLTVTRHGARTTLRATVTPAARGGRIVLQLYLPERFGWWPVRQAKLGTRSGATFGLHSKRHVRARVRYTLPDGATALATSRVVRLGPPARPVAPPMHGGHARHA